MTDLAPQDRAYYWSTLFFRELCHNGVTHVVISPGSRSTPLTLAAVSHPGLRTQVVLDERSAGFVALGIGKATGTPAVLISTSGTAVANYYPAVIEARLSGVPLILATADRPPNLRNTGANQAIDQLKIFGNYPVFFHEAGEPAFDKTDLLRLEMLAQQAVEASVLQKGPVHLNFPFRKPLEPRPSFVSETERENRSLLKQTDARTHTYSLSVNRPSISVPPVIRELIEQSERPLIVSGPLSGVPAAHSIQELAEIIDAPVLSEGGFASPYAIHGFEGFLRDETNRQNLEPDLILRFGFQPVGKAVERALRAWSPVPHIHFASSEAWHDATFSTTHRVSWQERPVDWNLERHAHSGWLARWKSAEERYIKKAESILAGEPALTDLHAYHYLTPQIPENWSVFLSNSFPVRDSQLAGRYRTPFVYLNRGASGIDGITSTAMGISIARSRPSVLFTGDLAFLHDTNALLSNHLLRQPLIVVILNNQGGNIFRMLPVAEHASYYRDFFETPQSAELSAMSGTYGVSYSLAANVEALANLDLIEMAETAGEGIYLIECRTNSEASMKLRHALWSGDGNGGREPEE